MNARQDRGRPTPQPDGFTYDPFAFAGQPGEWGRPDIDQGPRQASPDLIERAMAAYEFTLPDTRFANLASRFSRLFEW